MNIPTSLVDPLWKTHYQSNTWIQTGQLLISFLFFCAPNGEATDCAFKLHSARDFPPGAKTGVCVRMMWLPQYDVFWDHYRKLSNCRERKTLPWVSSWAHGKRAICRVQENKHSAKYEHTAKKVFAVCHKGKHTANSCTRQNKNFTKCFFCLPCV